MKTKLLSVAFVTAFVHFTAFAAEPSRAPKPDFVAHEWGTFTSVQGADGIQFEWNPFQVAELPSFVHDLNRPTPQSQARRLYTYGVKTAFRTLQRMETPVIYFYADREQKVDVTVNFPQGRITEWYPQLTAADPRAFAVRPNAIQWLGVKVLPQALHSALAEQLPVDKSGSHYYAARETDAGFLRVAADANSQPELEKFLFYRGVGNFTAPLTVTLFGVNDECIQLQNTGAEPLANLFVVHIGQAGAKFLSVDRLAADANKQVLLHPGKNLRPTGEVIGELAQRMTAALVKEGLYEREAAAMVQTWRDSWFAETGVRVLYTLPRAWTDRILPLTLEPKPREIQRVMVGRAEVLTPTMEWNLLKQVVHYSEADDATRPQVVADTRALGLGRFLEPTSRRLMGKVPGREFSALAWELMQATSKPAPAEKSVAQK